MKKVNEELLIEVPEIAKDILPEPENLSFYELLDKRIIYIVGAIDAYLLEFSKMIHIINIEDAGKPIEERVPIKVFIFSEGGEDFATWNFVDTVAVSKTPVWTINAGLCMSNGLSILVAGHKKFALAHSSGMYHSGNADLKGTKEQLDAATKYLASQDKMYEKWFMDHCNIDPKLFNRKKKTDWYFNAEEMLQYGIVDKIVESLDEVI